MREVLLLKLGEIILKGLNRNKFERQLINNINRRLSFIGAYKVTCMQSTVYVEPENGSDIGAAIEAVSKIFGIVSICRAARCEKNLDDIIKTAVEYLGGILSRAETFKVEARRADKTFPLKSPEIAKTVGGALHKAYPGLKVNVDAPQILVKVEIRDKYAFVHANPLPGAGGLPVGINGTAALLLSGGIDSPVAGYMMAKRGLKLHAVHFHSYPYTSERAKQKVIDLAKTLTAYTGDIKLSVVPFTRIQEEIRANCREDMFTLVMRRFMMRIAERIAFSDNCGALVTGESLGQVASQTMEALGVTGGVCSLPVLRPLIGMDKEDIVLISRKIDTYEISIRPYEDCCTVFTPKHPKTKPRPYDAESQEARLDVVALIEEALANTELLNIEREDLI